MTIQLNPSARSAADITKGDIEVMTLSESDVVELIDLSELLDGLAEGFRAIARGEMQSPHRPEITVPDKGFMLSMPAWRPGSPMMVKMVCVFEGNLALDLPNHLAVINLFDESTGKPLCVMDGTYITGIRTAGAAVLSVREISRMDSKVVTLVGAGVQGREHLRLLPLVRDFDEILISSLYHDDAEKLAARHPKAKAVTDLQAAIGRSDVVCLASHSYEPVIDASWIRPGTHVSSVGYAPPRGELPVELLQLGKLYVEDDSAFQAPPVGCGELQGFSASDAIKFGDALVGLAPLRERDDEVTVYKAMGIAMEDLVAAELAYRRALGLGNAGTALF